MPMLEPNQIAHNLASVRTRISEAAAKAGRQTSEVKLVAVTKGHPADAIKALADLGVETIGENYVDEALAKRLALAQSASVKWHMIGHIQSRKAKDVALNFDMVHSVDSLKIAQRLDKSASEAGKTLPILLEINSGEEASKHGWSPYSDQLFSDVEQIETLPGLNLRGLMSMAPIVESTDEARPFFARTRQLRDTLAARFQTSKWDELSMGMSDDFEAAILEGATLVRIGTAILGPRSV
jgi:pyridoxal phosphate enzyme (YggS family)